MSLLGKEVPPHNPRAAIRAGMAFVPEDRRKQGLVTEARSPATSRAVIRRGLTHFGLLTSRAENKASGPWAAKLEVKTNALDMAATTMSGGNQQKVVIAKWLATKPKLLIIDEPTRGIDVGTKAEVHRLLSDLAGEGLAVLMISSELPEVLGMADRVLVVCEGEITADIDRARRHPGERHVRRDAGAADRRRGERGDGMSDLLVEPSALSPTRRVLGGLLRSREISILLRAAAGDHGRPRSRAPSFLFSSDSWRDLLVTPSLLMLLAVGQAVVIITRNVDLSVGSILGLTAYLTGRLFIDHPGLPIVASWWPSGSWPEPLLGLVNGAAGRLRPGARPGHHAWDALHLPRHRAHLGRQQPDQRRRHASRVPPARHRSRSSASRC